MKMKHLQAFLLLTALEGVGVLIHLVVDPSDPERARFLGLSYPRLAMMVGVVGALAVLAWLMVRTMRGSAWLEKTLGRIHTQLTRSLEDDRKALFPVQGGLVLGMIAFSEMFLLTWFSFPYVVRPFALWGLAMCGQAWMILRWAYQGAYREKAQKGGWMRRGWREWTTVQRRVCITLGILGLIYFLAFIPANLGKGNVDENIILPDIVNMLLPGATFKETLQRVFVNENWWYGQPFLPFSAAALVIPRIVFGLDFGSQKMINLLFLRQLVSVLPMILAMMLLVYMVTRFRSAVYAVCMYVFLLLIPGVVKYCYRFWHPDSLLLLLVVLTIFFLQRDRLRFRRNFYLAAVTCGLAIAVKLWGFFFFLTIGGYLAAGLLKKAIHFRQAIVRGLLFILVMVLAVVLTSPSLFIPWSFDFMVFGLVLQNENNTQGYSFLEADPEGVYRTGLTAWLPYFGYYFMGRYFFFFAFLALGLGSLIGSQTWLNRILLSWCAVTVTYLVTFMAVKSFHYMLPAMVPLYAGVFLLPAITQAERVPGWLAFLAKPAAVKVMWAITIVVLGSQFILNVIDILNSANIGVFTKI